MTRPLHRLRLLERRMDARGRGRVHDQRRRARVGYEWIVLVLVRGLAASTSLVLVQMAGHRWGGVTLGVGDEGMKASGGRADADIPPVPRPVLDDFLVFQEAFLCR
ncbi:hypothetical protein K438DRAFT_1788456 [Mycena galopus ATCC 62051]|nr:hypothetical protein K438DRAFT_1788456 [Mycena galopus ATCC 62051]